MQPIHRSGSQPAICQSISGASQSTSGLITHLEPVLIGVCAVVFVRSSYPYQKDDGHELAGSGKEFKYRAMFDIIDMPWDWPVEVNYLEARAFLNWKQEQDGAVYRMPTEAEYHRIRGDASIWPEATPGKTPAGPGADLSDPLQAVDIIMQPEAPGNINLRYGSSSPVDAFPPSSTGFYDVHGNVWEWVEDHFGPLPGFKIHYTYDDFSTPCFDGWHTENLGGSWISVGELASNFARYHFRRHFFQHLGFRYVKVADPKLEPYPGAATVNNLWEGKDHVSKQITNHFGDKTLKVCRSADGRTPSLCLCTGSVRLRHSGGLTNASLCMMF